MLVQNISCFSRTTPLVRSGVIRIFHFFNMSRPYIAAPHQLLCTTLLFVNVHSSHFMYSFFITSLSQLDDSIISCHYLIHTFPINCFYVTHLYCYVTHLFLLCPTCVFICPSLIIITFSP